MSTALRNFVESALPPVLFDALRGLRALRYGFRGDYTSFEEALDDCHTPEGFSSERIVERVLQRAREGVDTPGRQLGTREQQLLAAVLTPLLACSAARAMRVFDFGGGVGTDYLRVRAALPDGWRLIWDILETPPMAQAGRTQMRLPDLRFLDDWPEPAPSYDLVLVSSSLQYTREPLETLERLLRLSSRFFILTRIPLLEGSRDRLSVQRVAPSYYDASYPAWFLAAGKWLPLLEREFRIRRQWLIPEDEVYLDGHRVPSQGFLLERR